MGEAKVGRKTSFRGFTSFILTVSKICQENIAWKLDK